MGTSTAVFYLVASIDATCGASILKTDMVGNGLEDCRKSPEWHRKNKLLNFDVIGGGLRIDLRSSASTH